MLYLCVMNVTLVYNWCYICGGKREEKGGEKRVDNIGKNICNEEKV